ncbi:MAG: pre-peptidase C-terminal domain-containing protein [Deltaproteobacteria bacterium]|nr:pre-peptidase C-terminal domain-containing protein [Deltaproteobacteria bacterium]
MRSTTRMTAWLALVSAAAVATACGGGIDSGYFVDADSGDAETAGDATEEDAPREDARDDGRDGDADADTVEDGGGDEAGPVCGDGTVDPGEECDDGGDNSDTLPDACRTDCRNAHCGDAVTDSGEGCDDGNTVDSDDCRNDCSLPTCGDGEVQGGEDCDDGNTIDTDDCLSTCVDASCGDGVVWTGREECDGTASDPCTTTCGTAGARECLDCAFGADCVPPAETCNGADDDCDLLLDDGFPCVRGGTTSCTTACGTVGSGTCTDSCAVPTGGACVAPAETCNGADDDCDGSTDEGLPCVPGATVACTTACGTAGTGTCTAACELPTGAACTPPAESCNGIDDDCDGGCDDGFACCLGATASCTTSCGTAGTGICAAGCALPGAGSCTPPAEACNAADDDCDTFVDDGFPCVQGTTGGCTTTCGSTGTGTCTATCALPTGAACTPPAEACNGTDDDCDTLPDDGFPCSAGDAVLCTTTCGTTGTGVCTAACAIPAPAACAGPAESCNAVDDDCDGATDETFACVRGATRACTVGTCSGTQTCSATCAWGLCGGGAAPANDNCSGSGIVTIPGSNGAYSYSGSTCGAASDWAYWCTAMTPADGADVVYRLDLAAPKSVVLSTTGTSFDAVLFLRSGATCPGTTATTCDDNSAGGTPGQARITRTLAAGTYWIVVDGATAGDMGNFALSAVISDAPVGPPNDTCATAIALTPSSTLQSVTGDTAAATEDNAGCAGSGGRDVWYWFRLPVSHAVYLSTVGATWDTVIHVRSGSCTGALTAYGCADDACGVSARGGQFVGILPAGTYYVAIDGFSAASSGAFTLYYQASACVAVRDADTGTAVLDPIRSTMPTLTGSTVGQGNDSTGLCAAGAGQIAPDVYYYLGLCPSRTVTMNTCGASSGGGTDFNTVLYARYGGCAASGAGDTACNNDDATCTGWPPGSYGSRISFGSTGQGLYYVFVDGYVETLPLLPSEGNYTLSVSGM